MRALVLVAVLSSSAFALEPMPPMPPCEAQELVERGVEYASNGMYAAALARFEGALRCRVEVRTMRLAFWSACKSRNEVKANRFYKHLPPADRVQLSQVCTREGIAVSDH